MFELAAFLVFIAGIIMKLFYLPYHTVVMMVALGSLVVLNIIRLVRNKPGVKRSAGWLGIATISWLIFFLFEVKFLGDTLIIMAAALFVSVVSLLMTLFEPGALPQGRIFLLLAALGLSATTSWMTPHQRFYTYNIRFNDKAEKDSHTLDKYSWFLYNGQEYNEALRISSQALNVAKEKGEKDFVPRIEEHTEAIKNRQWEKYN